MERRTVLDSGGIGDLGSGDRLVVNFLNHSSQSGSQHWILEFEGARPGAVSISTAGRRVVRETRVVDLSEECLRQLDEMFGATAEWERGAATYCDVRLRRFHGADLVAEETRLGVTPPPLKACTVLMSHLQAIPPTQDDRDLGARIADTLSGFGSRFFSGRRLVLRKLP